MRDKLKESVDREPTVSPANGSGTPQHVLLSDNSQDSVCEKTRKTKKLFADLSPEEEQTMVEWLESHPIVYNKKLAAYKDIGTKERLWREKATELRKPVKLLKIWYTSVRSRYGRLKKRCGHSSKDLTEREQWILRHFDFLRPFIYEVKKRTAGNRKKKVAASPIISEVKVEPMASAQHQMDTSESPRPTSPAPEVAEPCLSPQRPVSNRLEPSDERERETFMGWTRAVVRQLEYALWRRCQRDMSEILCRYLAEHDHMRRRPVIDGLRPSMSLVGNVTSVMREPLDSSASRADPEEKALFLPVIRPNAGGF